jgi:hypothetical protein
MSSYSYCTLYYDSWSHSYYPCASKCCISYDWCSSFSSSCDDTTSTAGSVAGGVVGGVFFIIFLIIVIVSCYRRRMAAQQLANGTANISSGETTIIMTNQQPAYGVNQSFSQPAYNQANNYNGQGYAQQVYPPQPMYNQPVYNQPIVQPYGQAQYAPGYYQQPNPVIIM